jgi:hypothetical protein
MNVPGNIRKVVFGEAIGTTVSARSSVVMENVVS